MIRQLVRLARTVALAGLVFGAAVPPASADPGRFVSAVRDGPAVGDDSSPVEHGEMAPAEYEEAPVPDGHAPSGDEPSTGEHQEEVSPDPEKGEGAVHEEMTDPEHQETVTPGEERTARTPRPRGLVLGSFALINAAVLVAAGILRRRLPQKGRRGSAAPAPAPSVA